MARGIFTLKQQLQGLQQKSWNAPFGNTYGAKFAGNGSGQYLLGPTTSALNFGTGNFTVEFWLYMNAYGGGGLTVVFSASNAAADFQLGVSTVNNAYWHNSGIQIATSSSSVALGRWTHFALVRSGTNCAIFCNGTRFGTATNSAAVNLTNFNVGSYQGSPVAYMLDGWVSNLRITNTAVYDPTLTSLVLPTGPLTAISGTQLLTLQNATIVDNSTNALTITNNGSVGMQIVNPFGIQSSTPAVDYLVVAGGGSGAGGGGGGGGLLQGSLPVTLGSVVTITVGAGGSSANGSNSVFGSITAIGGGLGGTGFNATNNSGFAGGSGGGGTFGRTAQNEPFGVGGQGVFGHGNAGASGWTNNPADSSQLQTSGGGGAGTVGLVGNATVAGNGGAGIASAISGTVTVYSGGGGGGTYTGSLSTTGQGGVGGGGRGGHTGNNAAAGTTNTGGGGGGALGYSPGAGGSGIVIVSYPDIYAAASGTTGSPTVSASGSGSMLPGSTGSWIYYAAQSGFAFGTGNFTIEFWVNFTSTTSGASGTSYLLDFRGANYSESNSALGIYQNSGGLQLFTQSGLNLNAGMPLINTWLNIAISRVSGTMYYFVNGNLISSGADSTNYTIVSTGPSFMGSGYYNNYGLQGYMSNIRVIKGTGLYTANYTVATTPYTAVTNTQLLLNTVSGGYLADGSTNAYAASVAGTVAWNQLSPFATGLGYKNRVYTFNSSGSITF